MEYGLIGEKLGHSFSKIIHEKIASYNYELKEISRDDIDLFIKKKDFKCINVTIPYKETVIPYLDFVSSEAKEIGAINTIVNKNGKLYGYNTDYYGLRALIEKNGIDVKGKTCLILGSGGTSKTARCVLKKLDAKNIFFIRNSYCNLQIYVFCNSFFLILRPYSHIPTKTSTTHINVKVTPKNL